MVANWKGGTKMCGTKNIYQYKINSNLPSSLFVFVPGTITPESRKKNYSAPIGSMGN